MLQPRAFCRVMRSFAALLVVASSLCLAEPQFPQLTGRVVDTAGVLSPELRQTLTSELAAHESETSNQVVVVTLASLQGYAIDDYGYQLGRHWGIGQKGKNNGVLLIVAPNERKVRIEVGYGLEGTLTDALSNNIIQTVILPRFKKGDMPQGIVAGVHAIVQTLQGTYEPSPTGKVNDDADSFFILIVVFLALGEFLVRHIGSRFKSAGILGLVAFITGWAFLGLIGAGLLVAFFVMVFHFFFGGGSGGPGSGGYYSGGYGGGYSSGGGFSGGGGSFGGGGASGGW